MSEINNNINYEGVEEFDLATYCEDAYLNYATYVIKDRVLPYIGDGLKPVQRRIIYTMAIEGINSKEKKKKSAYTVGQVLGRFHPHGDLACYESLVIMAQNFSYRYPLVSGQGNFGELFNPKGFAAMRYTESFLSPYAKSLLRELNAGNVDFEPNYNGDEKEPVYLPSLLPNILLNGTTGIAVGMATDIPPHNVNEIVDACCLLIDEPKSGLEQVMQYVKGPDYPTGAEITNSYQELYEIYKTGRGTIRQRAVWHQEKDQIIITELPAQSATTLIPKIAELIQSKKTPQIEDVRDDSSENEVRVVLQLKSSRVDGQSLMQQLFVQTDLEKTQRVNLNMIGLNDRPAVKGLVEILNEWIEFRKIIVRRRYEHRLEKVAAELMRIAGFLIAFNNLEQVIAIVRNSEKPKDELMATFSLTEEQATAILDLRVRNLAKLEEQALRKQEQELLKEQKQINSLLASKAKFNQQVKKELLAAKEEFGNPRLSKLVEREAAKPVEVQEEISQEPVTVVISKQGWIRCGKGHGLNLENLNYRNGDEFAQMLECQTTDTIYFIDSTGRSYSLMANTLPSMRGYGEAITAFFKLPDQASIRGMFTAEPKQFVLLSSTSGDGFLTEVENFETKSKAGRNVFTLKEQAQLLAPIVLPADFSLEVENGKFECLPITNKGRCLKFEVKEIPSRAKGSGVKLININSKDFTSNQEWLKYLFVVDLNNSLQIKNGSRKSNISVNDLNKVKSTRGNKGRNIIKGLTDNSVILIK
ncbi:DNA topoisomerase IV subunit A [Psittacicella melopsittaci]|uniref:DNA topoisomerase IV subunit A n=1 Tax=Psittacicella melopsittaci TaxID=2028576 RepID=A0A3A1Y6R1_9GAMM|nr:DNA topoisomerase IV subunit A [Psittacicella melopsittaci]RIY32996.1 DNA topoisomerase IV subunit A [Psittacicella melopsittaci]